MKHGTMLDFLQLVEEDASLQKELVELAHKYGFEFESEDLTDDQLDAVSGGGDDAQLANIDLQSVLQRQQRMLSMLSTISKTLHGTRMAIIRKIGG
jgi:hypothetical protein